MKNITSEQIDNIINKAFREQNENVFNDFVNNYEAYKKICDEYIRNNVPNAPSDYAERFTNDIADAFASFTLAQDNCIEILKYSLKELLCEKQ